MSTRERCHWEVRKYQTEPTRSPQVLPLQPYQRIDVHRFDFGCGSRSRHIDGASQYHSEVDAGYSGVNNCKTVKTGAHIFFSQFGSRTRSSLPKPETAERYPLSFSKCLEVLASIPRREDVAGFEAASDPLRDFRLPGSYSPGHGARGVEVDRFQVVVLHVTWNKANVKMNIKTNAKTD